MVTKKSTAKTKSSASELSSGAKVSIGVGLTAAAVAAAGAYFLYGSEKAAKNRGKVRSWALKAKAEVLERLEQAKEMTKEEYESLIGTVVGAYSGVQNVTKGELKNFTDEMKAHWKAIEKATVPKKKVVKKAAATKTAVKKAAKKATS